MYIKITYYFIFFLLIFHISSCQKELSQPTISFGKYILMDITSDEPVDLNDDGISNRDLKKELTIFNKTALYLYDGAHPSFDLIWPEIFLNNKPINGYSIELLDVKADIQYVTISLQYYISFDEEMKTMRLEQPLTSGQKIYSLVIPKTMNINTKNEIVYFNSYHKFYSNGVIQNLPVTIKFSKLCESELKLLASLYT